MSQIANSFLSPRELEVLELFAGGATYGDVARLLAVSINTVRQHVRHIYGKLGVGSKVEAVLCAREREG
jgi:DNA-binding CsgD family transcriptional regulator